MSTTMERKPEVKAAVSEKPKIVPSKLAHFVCYTARFSEMVTWYKHVLQATASYENDFVSFLTYDDEHHRVAFVSQPHLKDRPKGLTGFHHVAFTYANLHDFLVTLERLAEGGLRPYWTINHGPTTSAYFQDPDSNRIELQIDNFATNQEGIDYCALPEFAENPVGVDFDPAELLRRLRNGESETELKKRPRIGPRGIEGMPPETYM